MSAFLKDLSTKLQDLKKSFYEICYCYTQIISLYSLIFFDDKGQVLYYNVAVYISVHPKEEYSLIQKAKPLTVQTDKGKWLKKLTKGKK